MRVTEFYNCVCCVVAKPDDERLLAVGLWQDRSGFLDTRTGWSKYFDHYSYVNTIAFSPSSSSSPTLLLAAGLHNRIVQVWNCNDLNTCIATLRGHEGSVLHVAFSPNGKLLASASRDTTVRLWKTADWHAPPIVLQRHDEYVLGVSFSHDSHLLATCSHDSTVKLWRIFDQNTVALVASVDGAFNDRSVWSVAFSPIDTTLLAYGGGRGDLVLANVITTITTKRNLQGHMVTITTKRNLQGHTDTVRKLAFSPCGQKLASASASKDKTIRLWNVASGICLRVLRGHTCEVGDVAFFPNGKQLASCSWDHTVRIWTLCAWSDRTHHLFDARFKAAVFTLMCVRAQLKLAQNQNLPRLPIELWLLIFGQLQLAWNE